jgi:transcriptional regulator with XRE-family HTH domain
VNPAQAIQAHVGGSQRSVARAIGEPQPAWNRYLKGQQTPSVDKVASWVDAIGVDLSYTRRGWAVVERTP